MMLAFRGSGEGRLMLSLPRRLINSFLWGLLFPVVSTLALCMRMGHISLRTAWPAQVHSSLLHFADVVPLVFALAAVWFPHWRAQTKAARTRQALTVSMLALTGLPMLLLVSARREDARAGVQFADVNTSGSLRFRSMWLYGAGQPDAHVPLAMRAAQRNQICAIRDTLHARYPADVAATNDAWTCFDTDFRAHGRVGWQTAQSMRDAADQLTRRIERHARAQAQQASRLLFWGTFGLALSGLGSLVLLRHLRQSEETQRRLGDILDSAPDLIGMADPQGRILYLNHAFRRFFCLPDDAALPHLCVSDLHPPQSCTQMEAESRPMALAAARRNHEHWGLHVKCGHRRPQCPDRGSGQRFVPFQSRRTRPCHPRRRPAAPFDCRAHCPRRLARGSAQAAAFAQRCAGKKAGATGA